MKTLFIRSRSLSFLTRGTAPQTLWSPRNPSHSIWTWSIWSPPPHIPALLHPQCKKYKKVCGFRGCQEFNAQPCMCGTRWFWWDSSGNNRERGESGTWYTAFANEQWSNSYVLVAAQIGFRTSNEASLPLKACVGRRASSRKLYGRLQIGLVTLAKFSILMWTLRGFGVRWLAASKKVTITILWNGHPSKFVYVMHNCVVSDLSRSRCKRKWESALHTSGVIFPKIQSGILSVKVNSAGKTKPIHLIYCWLSSELETFQLSHARRQNYQPQ